MEQQQINEGNKIIDDMFVPSCLAPYNDYDRNWERLMYVVEHLEKMQGFCLNFTIDSSGCQVEDLDEGFSFSAQATSKILSIFHCAVESIQFIKRIGRIYFAPDGQPIKCRKCGSDNLHDRTMNGQDGHIWEFERSCTQCKEKLGWWAYGAWVNS